MKYVLLTILLGCLTAYAAPVADVQVGVYEDGSKMLWQCQPQAQGDVKFMFIGPDGTEHTGTLTCAKFI